jgi:hypothetical protein
LSTHIYKMKLQQTYTNIITFYEYESGKHWGFLKIFKKTGDSEITFLIYQDIIHTFSRL